MSVDLRAHSRLQFEVTRLASNRAQRDNVALRSINSFSNSYPIHHNEEAFLQPSKESLTNNPFSRFLTAVEIENLYTQSPDFDVYTYHCELEQQKRIATYYKKTAPVGRGVKVDTGKGMGMRIKDCARGGYIKKVNKRGSIKKERKVRKGG